jgi:hypothetical protein
LDGKDLYFSPSYWFLITKGTFGDTTAAVSGHMGALLYAGGGTSAYAGNSITLTVGAMMAMMQSDTVASVTLPVESSDLARVNSLRGAAGKFFNKYNNNTTINTVDSMVDLVSAGSVGTLISGNSPDAYISTNWPVDPSSSTGVILGSGLETANSVVTHGGLIHEGSLSAYHFTLGTLSNGMLYIEDTGSASAENAVTGSATVYFSSPYLLSGNFVYFVDNIYNIANYEFGVVVNISRPSSE